MPFLQSSFPRIFRLAAFLALLAVLAPVIIGILHHPAGLQSFVHICGSAPTNGDHDKAPASQLPLCPICQSLHLLGGGIMPPTAVILAILTFRSRIVRPPFHPASVPSHDTPQAQPRAPPVLA